MLKTFQMFSIRTYSKTTIAYLYSSHVFNFLSKSMGIQTGFSVSEQGSRSCQNRKLIHGWESPNMGSLKTYAELI